MLITLVFFYQYSQLCSSYLILALVDLKKTVRLCTKMQSALNNCQVLEALYFYDCKRITQILFL